MNALIPLMVVVPIICALFLNILHKRDRTIKIITIILALILPALPILANYGLHYFGGYAPLIDNPTLGTDLPSLITGTALNTFHPAITYSFQSAQKIFVFILGLVGLLAIFTSLFETRRPSGVYGYMMFMGIAAVTAVLLTDDIFNLYVFFEIAALATVGIVLVSNIKGNYETALKYMILGGIAAPMLLLGVALLLGVTGNVNITDIIYSLKNGLVNPQSPVLLMACGLIVFGWLYGSGLPPFHTIKSAIYSKALPSGAALIQAFSVFTFIALGIIILRIFSYLPFSQWVILGVSLLAMILGITMAILQTDLRRMIGFLAVGELGYIGIGLGLGTVSGITAGLFQAVNEAVITAFLFIGFGTVLYQTGISDTRKLGGMLVRNPLLALLVLLAGFAMAGVPPLNAFQSKLMLIQASITAGLPELGVIMILLSIVTFMTFMKAFHAVFLRQKPADLEIKNENIPKATIIAMLVFLVVCIVFGLFPQMVTSYLQPLATSLGGVV
ncbi:energy conserving hydrogenase EhbF [Methanobacterium petrolearium]|uniref:energy conserving hydrogenase EhbF n=1 Tax=Methanobacterium petrolearium TaxID=710190 RepID=UPI001AEA902C|nr:energy conserving hydrogenase EhbF [Methanobacterium petrolearium]MBP1946472.1 energy-converting hydrogenase B subunit F [Methanobacterium petrolearium]BDZ69809.1 hydrogenase [Methanobacterium petrolearium]